MLLVFIVGIPLALYNAELRMSLGRLRQAKPPVARFTATDETLTVATELGSTTVPWSRFTGLSERPRFWQLHTSPITAATLPTDEVSPNALAFFRAKLLAHARNA